MKHPLLGLALIGLAACNPPPVTSGDDTTDAVVDTPAPDTDVYETGWGSPDLDTDRGGGGGGGSTRRCPFGEVKDCNNVCFPEYFVGDGSCDDGTAFTSNFDCAEKDFDGGDCLTDTDPPIVPPAVADTCPVFVRIFSGNWAVEMGWSIDRPNGTNIYTQALGSFTVNNTWYAQVVDLEPGNYRFVMQDLLGDGWNGGSYTLTDFSGAEIASGAMNTGFSARDSFSVTCDVDTDAPVVAEPECGDLELAINTLTFGWQVGWVLKDAEGTVIAQAPSNTYQNNNRYTHETSLPSGWYVFTLTDAMEDGWNGSTFSLTDRSTGEVMLDGTLATGGRQDLPFLVNCSDTFEPGIPPLGDVLTCDPLVMSVDTLFDAEEVGWQILDDAGAVVIDMQPGVYIGRGTFNTPVELPTGEYTVRMLDAGGDGWQGASFSLLDVTSGFAFAHGGATFTSGSSADVAVGVACPTPAPPGPTTCPAGSVEDCAGVCWPTTYVGDGWCDDGTVFAPNFACARFTFDGGDCTL